MMSVFFSLVVVSYNAGELITPTLNSILSQDFEDYEIIVKDGLSTDDTLARIPESSKIHVYSEADKGIYDAMNEALSYCNGKYVAFINCGEELYSKDTLRKVYECALKVNMDSSVIYGDLSKKGVIMNQMRKVSMQKLYRTTLCHQTLFYNMEIFKRYGLYDTSLRLCADYEHIIRIFKKGCSFTHCNCIVVNYMGDGVSESRENAETMEKEHKIIFDRYYSSAQQTRYKFFYSILYGSFMVKLRRKIEKSSFGKIPRKMCNFLVRKGIL